MGHSTEVEAALATLRDAGWEIREDTGHGDLYGGVLFSRFPMPGDPSPPPVKHRRTVAQQPWTPDA
jgi:hypothetical protein